MHIGSGVDYAHLEQVCGAMVRQVVEFGQDLEAISAGGGLSIPYREGEEAIDTDHYFGLWNAARDSIARHLGHAVKLEIEPGVSGRGSRRVSGAGAQRKRDGQPSLCADRCGLQRSDAPGHVR